MKYLFIGGPKDREMIQVPEGNTHYRVLLEKHLGEDGSYQETMYRMQLYRGEGREWRVFIHQDEESPMQRLLDNYVKAEPDTVSPEMLPEDGYSRFMREKQLKQP